jgi:hypothetical protein
MKTNYEYIGGDAQKWIFHELKVKVTFVPILKPIQGWSFYLHIDWSTLRLKTIFTQLDHDDWKFIVAYFSWSNNKTRAKYSLYEGECLVIV